MINIFLCALLNTIRSFIPQSGMVLDFIKETFKFIFCCFIGIVVAFVPYSVTVGLFLIKKYTNENITWKFYLVSFIVETISLIPFIISCHKGVPDAGLICLRLVIMLMVIIGFFTFIEIKERFLEKYEECKNK